LVGLARSLPKEEAMLISLNLKPVHKFIVLAQTKLEEVIPTESQKDEVHK